MAGIEHRHWTTRSDLGALLLLPFKPIPTMDLPPGAGTAGGFTLSRQELREGGGGGGKKEAASLLSLSFSLFKPRICFGVGWTHCEAPKPSLGTQRDHRESPQNS